MQGKHSRGENTDSLKKKFSRRRFRDLKRDFQNSGDMNGIETGWRFLPRFRDLHTNLEKHMFPG